MAKEQEAEGVRIYMMYEGGTDKKTTYICHKWPKRIRIDKCLFNEPAHYYISIERGTRVAFNMDNGNAVYHGKYEGSYWEGNLEYHTFQPVPEAHRRRAEVHGFRSC